MLKVRQKVVADGLDHTLDWESAGYDMPPLEWHQKLKEAKQAKQSGDDEKIQKAPLKYRVDLPKVLEDGSIYAPEEKIADNVDPFQQFWTLNSDTDVEKSFLRALDFFKSHNEQVAENVALKLKRPCLLIHVEKDLESELPQPLYLHNMPSPKDTTHMTMLSFYSFPPSGIEDPDNFMIFVKKAWEPFDCLGRVYIAHEGINAQMLSLIHI